MQSSRPPKEAALAEVSITEHLRQAQSDAAIIEVRLVAPDVDASQTAADRVATVLTWSAAVGPGHAATATATGTACT
ncbi:hypothetical protein [Virgisporangium aurantiacum]|uniref:Uncharacterized protein n=1 Tax=Virgisporangium aurantiacum TaxID=175570 RepID=A0A8J3ZL34_9ACTN|nr:hypothetical protein [Virgisporangium aurantiacum]GIJ63471.1 hypothetical protein Vau01_109870 [Virgisporangium aurantiacum]